MIAQPTCHTRATVNLEKGHSEQVAKYLLGFGLHAVLGSAGSLVFSLLVATAVDAVVKPAPNDSLVFVGLSISSMLIVFLLRFKADDWVSCRWFSLTAPWVGLLGLAALFLGVQDSSSEMRFFSEMLFVSWTSYSRASLGALWIARRRRSDARTTETPARSAEQVNALTLG
jgi:hypothetical protein